uniref:BTB domain-containing protein n=1 Tax=Panagrolaimus davidi TaxID=227884 RepID=A0A914PH51_9BILA
MEDYNLIPIEHEWKISEELLKNLDAGGDDYSSEKKDLQQCPGIQYGLKACFEENDEGEEVLKMTLALYGTTGQSLNIHGNFAFYVKSADFSTKYDNAFNASDSERANCYYGDEVDKWTREICTKDDLLNPQKKFIDDEYLVVAMKGMLLVDSGSHFKDLYARDDDSDTEAEAPQSLGDYLWKGNDRDFEIIVGKKDATLRSLNVHKCVLSSRSKVFERMIKTDMKENREGRVHIEDFDWDNVEAAVEYLYDQRFDPFSNGLTNAFSLLQFAENLVKEKLLPENVVGISNAAIISNSPTLRDFCSDALLIFTRHGIQVENIDDLDEGFSKDLFKKAFSGKYAFNEKIYAEKIDCW